MNKEKVKINSYIILTIIKVKFIASISVSEQSLLHLLVSGANDGISNLTCTPLN